MEERKEINLKDYNPADKQHAKALENIKNFNFSTVAMGDILNLITSTMFNKVGNLNKFDIFTSLAVNDTDDICINACLIKHIDKTMAEHLYFLFTPFDVWAKTNTNNIYYRHKALTSAWRAFMVERYPLYLERIIDFLSAERNRLMQIVNNEIDFSLLPLVKKQKSK